MTLDSYTFTNQGGRSYNEDYVGVKRTEKGALYLLADGLGGHLHGEQASKGIVDFILGSGLPKEDEDRQAWLETVITASNDHLLKLQQASNQKMKSTVVALYIEGEQAVFANVGDSRLYCLQDGKISGVTEDHSVAYRKFKSGQITRDQIGSDEDQSCLLRCLGSPDHFLPDGYTLEGPLQAGDGFLLCSDGMWEYLLDEEILVDFLKADCARTWAELLLLRAMDRFRPGNDNLSLITVMVGE